MDKVTLGNVFSDELPSSEDVSVISKEDMDEGSTDRVDEDEDDEDGDEVDEEEEEMVVVVVVVE